MLGGANRVCVPAHFADPTADASYVIARVPEGAGKMTVTGASFGVSATKAAHAANGIKVKLQKVGADGATTPVDITEVKGDTSGGNYPAWTANRPLELTLVSGVCVLDEGEYIVGVYDEEGTVAPGV